MFFVAGAISQISNLKAILIRLTLQGPTRPLFPFKTIFHMAWSIVYYVQEYSMSKIVNNESFCKRAYFEIDHQGHENLKFEN